MFWIDLPSSEMCYKALSHSTKLWIISQSSKLFHIDQNSLQRYEYFYKLKKLEIISKYYFLLLIRIIEQIYFSWKTWLQF